MKNELCFNFPFYMSIKFVHAFVLAPDDGDSTDMLPIILGCVFGGLLLIVLIVVACLLCTKQTKFRKVSPEPVPMAGCKLHNCRKFSNKGTLLLTLSLLSF